MIPVILSGGSGTRLWPLSRESYPKQFLALAEELPMLQATWRRVADLASRAPIVVANEEHRFKAIVSELKAAGRPGPNLHRKVYRPWGSYDSIDMGERFQVKRITVNPEASLSLQMHHHRAEHWIVVRGTGRITRGEETILLAENQSTYIPIGVKHRLENPGRVPLQLIEVQSGSYLGEDDIVRFEDVYGRD